VPGQGGRYCNVEYSVLLFEWGFRGATPIIDNKSSAVAEMRDRLATIGMGPKWGGAAVGAGSPSNTMWPGPRPTSLPTGIFIHPAVWPQL